VSLVCPSCEEVPDAGATLGSACPKCGATLVRVADSDPLIGTTLDGRFKIVEHLGAGAMGVVYRATQLSIGRDVAVKVMTGMDAASIKRFFREAKIASTLSHPNTVPIIEFGQHEDGQVYLAMELVRGRTLFDEMAEHGALASRRICHIGTQLCDALEAAHKLTIVHRDLKPENVMVSLDGSDHVKILDFGIARVLDDSDSRITTAGLAAGTPNYMAPEVLGKGAEPAPPQDIYALGVMIAELALGTALWRKSTLEMLYVEKTTNAAIDRVPPRMRPLVLRMVDPDPAKRPTAAETRKLLRELDRVATDPVGVAPTSNIQPVAADKPIDLSALGNLQVVGLDDRADAKRPPDDAAFAPPLVDKPPKSREEAGKVEMLMPDVVNLAPSDEKIELETGWRAEKAERVANKKQLSPLAQRVVAEDKQRRAATTGYGLSVFVILAIAGAGVYFYIRMTKTGEDPTAPVTPAITKQPTGSASTPDPKKPGPWKTPDRPVVDKSAPQDINSIDSKAVSIRIIGANGTPITINGSPAGKTPASLKITGSTKALVIGAKGKKWKVIPDRDQTIDITQ